MEHNQENTDRRLRINEIIARKLKQLPESDQNLLMTGAAYVGVNAAFCGLTANSFFRRILNVTQARISSALPMAVLPFVSTYVIYKTVVSLPLSSGELNCEACTVIRGGLVGLIIGGLHPVLLAIPINGALAARYNSAPLPERGNIWTYWIRVSRPVFRKMVFPIMLQTALAAYLGSKQFEIVIKAFELPEPGFQFEDIQSKSSTQLKE
ncbi:transmembrane protein 126A [Antechinus flavipes]|uniref:transmembrane protein 126A n=1 Tax=Antechinus flavipes TaxID=38775 RepID=UPI002236A128|nr:transmembrane protein 126A [Antechinus flavipes]XP_051843217.1 transmembrane protein 126A [Antechinus flavipes]XP_051843218.1 transmembrane protein 126A [Antechinus flavipes]XP_051843220.1 transmembrane protein 126A [Antechinus flavipes]